VPAEIAEQAWPIETPDGFPRAQNRSAQSVVSPVTLGEELVHQIVWRVLHHLDLFLDHLGLFVDMLVAQQRILDQVSQHVEGAGQVFVQHFDGEAGALLGGEGVQVAADGIRRARDFFG